MSQPNDTDLERRLRTHFAQKEPVAPEFASMWQRATADAQEQSMDIQADIQASIQEKAPLNTTNTPANHLLGWRQTFFAWVAVRGWQPFAVAAGFMMVTLLVVFSDSNPTTPAGLAQTSDELFESLAASTTWQAPSDIFLPDQSLHIWGVPEFDWPSNSIMEKTL